MNFKHKCLSAALLSVLTPFTAQAVVLPLIADTYLAPTNAGTSVAININTSNKALLNFDASTLPVGIMGSDIAKATLVFFVKTIPASGQIQISPVTSPWTENTVNTLNAPIVGLPLATSASINRNNSYFAVDVTNLVMNWVDTPASNFGLALDPVGLASITLDSKEAIQTSHPAYIELVIKGPAGAVGKTGAPGINGTNGLNGAPGAQGAPGVNGINGTNGLNGAKGDTGAFPSGTTKGDMQYWNGTAWVMIPTGADNTNLKNCKAIPTWVVTSCPGSVFAIGDTGPAGGKVFYLTDKTGLHGLEAAPVDQASAPWGCYGSNLGSTSTAVGTGKANTEAINAKCGAGTAANIAANYTLNGYSDWYLPSKDELNLLYLQRNVVGGFANNYYWSSSEHDLNYAWIQYFPNGSQYGYTKNSSLPVRAVRAF